MTAMAFDGLFSGIVSGERELQIAVEARQQIAQIMRAGANVLFWIIAASLAARRMTPSYRAERASQSIEAFLEGPAAASVGAATP
jgi:hypothetical protein